MRKGIHPENYRLVAFKDMSNDDVFITKSTAEAKETISVDGVEYPLVELTSSRISTRNLRRKKRRRPSRSYFSTKYRNALDTIRGRFLFLQNRRTSLTVYHLFF